MQGDAGGTHKGKQPHTGLSVVHVRQETGRKNFVIWGWSYAQENNRRSWISSEWKYDFI